MMWLWRAAHQSDAATVERLEAVAQDLEEVTVEVRQRIRQIKAADPGLGPDGNRRA